MSVSVLLLITVTDSLSIITMIIELSQTFERGEHTGVAVLRQKAIFQVVEGSRER